MQPEEPATSVLKRIRTVKKRNILQNLQNRQLFGRLTVRSRELPSRMYHTIPRRLVFKLSSILPQHLLPNGHVFLGFLRDGNHVVSYTKTEEYRNDVMFRYRYYLQFWWFTPTNRLELQRQVELFSVASSIFITISQWPSDDSKVIAVAHPLDLLYEPHQQSMVLVTIVAVPPLQPCPECSTRKFECLEHGLIFQTTCSLNAFSVTDPKIMAGVRNHVLINTTSTLVCHELRISRRTNEPVKESPAPNGAWNYTTVQRDAQTLDSNPYLSGMFPEEALGDEESDSEPREADSAFRISEPLANAQDWVFSQSMSKRTRSYFCEKIYSKERSNLSLYNGSKDRPLFLHPQLPEVADEYVEMTETHLEFDYCCGFIGARFCAEMESHLASILNYDGKILDFCPYSRIVTISLCIQIDSTTRPPTLEVATDSSDHVGYELFVVLLWSVATGDLQIRHLQHKQFTLDSKDETNDECPESFRLFYKNLFKLRATKLGPVPYDLNVLSHRSDNEERSVLRLANRERTLCLTL